MSMEIAKHLGNRQTMCYDGKDFPHDQVVNKLAYNVLRNVPKFQEQNDTEILPGSPGSATLQLQSSQTPTKTIELMTTGPVDLHQTNDQADQSQGNNLDGVDMVNEEG